MLEIPKDFTGLILVGERRSPTAIEKGWSWQQCQAESPRLCAIKLFDSLEQCGYVPAEQIFLNVYNDNGELDEIVVRELRDYAVEGHRIVGMGQIVQSVLTDYDIPHLKLVHPAARGIWKKTGVYESHVRLVLG